MYQSYIMKAVICEVKLQSNHGYLEENNIDSVPYLTVDQFNISYKKEGGLQVWISLFFGDK